MEPLSLTLKTRRMEPDSDPDPHQSKISDTDQDVHQSEKSHPDPHPSDMQSLDPQHWL
jgi:hypothetical protein